MRPEMRRRERPGARDVTHQECLLSMKHPSSAHSSECEEGCQPLSSEPHHWHLDAAFSTLQFMTKSLTKSLQDLALKAHVCSSSCHHP